MKKLVLTKNEKIVAVIMLFWTFISISNYLTEAWWHRDPGFHFINPISNFLDFFEYYFAGRTPSGYDNSELMVYAVLPWLVFFAYLFLKKRD